jgi:hypothetical protein
VLTSVRLRQCKLLEVKSAQETAAAPAAAPRVKPETTRRIPMLTAAPRALLALLVACLLSSTAMAGCVWNDQAAGSMAFAQFSCFLHYDANGFVAATSTRSSVARRRSTGSPISRFAQYMIIC